MLKNWVENCGYFIVNQSHRFERYTSKLIITKFEYNLESHSAYEDSRPLR